MRNVVKKVVSLCMAFVLALGLVVVVMPTEVEAQQGWHWVVEPQFSGADAFSEGLAAAAVGDAPNRLWGFINKSGGWVIEPQFAEMPGQFFEGLAIVRGDGGLGFIDQNGNWVVQPQFWNASPFSDGLASVSGNIGIGFIDRAGNMVVDLQDRNFSHLGPIVNGLATAQITIQAYERNWEYWGFIDTTGNWVIQPEFAQISRCGFREGVAAVAIDDGGSHVVWGYIDIEGNWVIEPQFWSAQSFYNGFAIVDIFHDDSRTSWTWGHIIDRDANIVSPMGSFTHMADGFFEHNGHDIYDSEWNILFESAWIGPGLMRAASPSEGLLAVRYTNTQGEVVGYGFIALNDTSTPPTFTHPPSSTDNGTWMEFTVNPANRYGFRVFRATSATAEGISISDFPITINPAHGLNRIITFDPNVRPSTQYWYYVREVLQEARFDIATATLTPEVLGKPSARVSVTTSADVPAPTAERGFIMMFVNNPYMNVNNVWEGIDPPQNITAPIITAGRTMVPVRAIVEAMGGTVGWYAPDYRIDLRSHGNHVQMWLGQRGVLVNGASDEMDIVPTTVNARTLIPLRFVAEFLGSHIEWIGSQEMIVIVYELQS